MRLSDEFERIFDAVEDLLDWLETYDAIQEPSIGPVYDNVEDLIAALKISMD